MFDTKPEVTDFAMVFDGVVFHGGQNVGSSGCDCQRRLKIFSSVHILTQRPIIMCDSKGTSQRRSKPIVVANSLFRDTTLIAEPT